MRFKIEEFGVDDLLLDEGNYRFKAAKDQKECIEKIYASNQKYFKNLITSIAVEDLGEPLLVYQSNGLNTVLDGNRRLAVLKVLSDPNEYAPSEPIKAYAKTMLEQNGVVLTGIQAQVSSDKNVIYRTVYERHAAGEGKSRIGWSAYGAARFRYIEQVDEDKEWYVMALLLEAEKKYSKLSEFIDSDAFSYEVFRRIMRPALQKGIVSQGIFSDRKQRLRKNADKSLLKDATDKVSSFLQAMQSKDLTLSRSGKYADRASVDAYLTQFDLSADNARTERPADCTTTGNAASASSDDNGETSKSSDTPTETASSKSESSKRRQQGYGVNASDTIEQKLNELQSDKLAKLYNSLCTVSLNQHAQLLYTGAWSFFESLSTLLGKGEGVTFDGFIGSKVNSMGYSRQEKKDFAKPLRDIADIGNLNKHSSTYHSVSALQLKTDFNVLEPLIIDLIDMCIKQKKAP